jgi:chloride channel protein, CIC family
VVYFSTEQPRRSTSIGSPGELHGKSRPRSPAAARIIAFLDAGAVFVLEELVRRFDTRITVTTLCASGSAIAVARLLLGNGPDLQLEPLPYPGFGTVPIFLVLGTITGLLGVAYNHVILGALAAAERLGRWLSGDVRAMTIGAAVGLLAWFGPGLVGGGDAITQRSLAGGDSMMLVGGVFLVRFGLGPVSYATGTPGGLFAPLLVLGLKAVLPTLLGDPPIYDSLRPPRSGAKSRG